MPREITTHHVNGCNEALKIEVLDDPGSGGANHEYLVTLPPRADPSVAAKSFQISFQNGPIPENGTNGLTQEVLLAIVADRLEGFQRGPYASHFNARALSHVEKAIEALNERTKSRMDRGVEGTLTV